MAIALYIFYLDYYLKVPWSEHKDITVYAVYAYFILNCSLSAWIWFGERGVVFVGSRSKGKDGASALTLRLGSHAPKSKFEPVYRLAAEWTATTSAGKEEKGRVDAEAPFRLFFQADGTFVSGEFERWLQKTVPVIAGSRAAVAGGGDKMGPKVVIDNPPSEDDDVIRVEPATPMPKQSGRESTPGGTAKKRSKKKG